MQWEKWEATLQKEVGGYRDKAQYREPVAWAPDWAFILSSVLKLLSLVSGPEANQPHIKASAAGLGSVAAD